MNRFLLVHSPGDYDIYDYTSRVAGLDFDIGSVINEILRPNINNWDKVLRALHEYAHFYQFTCTTYGFLSSFFAFCQATMVHSFLVELGHEGGKYNRPLVTESNLPPFDSSKKTTFIIRLINWLENLRLGLYGHCQFEPDLEGFKETIERVALRTFFKTQFDIHELIFSRSIDFNPPRYLIEDVLESHAHALSTSWVIGLMLRQGTPQTTIDEVVKYSMKMAKGPYKQFIQVRDSGNSWWDHWTYCALCDIALNPPLFNFEEVQKDTAIHLVERNWNPSYRLLGLLLNAAEHGLPKPGDPNDIEMGRDYLKQIQERYGYDENYVAKFPESESIVPPLKTASMQMLHSHQAPLAINLMWLDTIGIFQNICRLRSSSPLLLSGNPRQLDLLFPTIGGPNMLCRSASMIREYYRKYFGLCVLELWGRDEMENGSGNLYKSSTMNQCAVNRLLYYGSSEKDQSVIPVNIAENAVEEFIRVYGVTKINVT